MEFLKKSFFIVVLLFFFSSILIKVDAENNEDITPERLLFDSKVFFKQKDIPACINNLKMIINRFPDSLEVEEAYFMLGDCYNSDIKFYQDLDAAREAYQAALDRYSDSLLKEETYLKLASVYEKTGNLLEASLLLDKIVREFPNIKN
ncbi:tetratricopeptide repeat protein, partial [bacterium]|nr:tetratricopeptide repeat protein [bacterium]